MPVAALVNHLPTQDNFGGLKRIVVERIGWDDIQTANGVQKLLDTLGEICQSPTFVRLITWQKK